MTAEPYRRKVVIGDILFDVLLDGFESSVTLYAIEDAASRVVYVGSTTQPIWERIRAHVRDAAKGSGLPIHQWMRGNPEFKVRCLGTCSEGERVDLEMRWIAHFGDGLLNLTNGGPGMSGHKLLASHAGRIGAALRRGAHFDCEQCGTQFWRKPRDIKQGNNRFCSRECYASSLRGVSRPVPIECTEAGIAAAAAARRARTHCRLGHPLSGDNLFINKLNRRVCKECRKLHKIKYLGGKNAKVA